MKRSNVYVISSDDDDSDDEGIQLVSYKKSKPSPSASSSSTKPSSSKTTSSTSTPSSSSSINNNTTTTTTSNKNIKSSSSNNNNNNKSLQNNQELKYNGNEIYFNKLINDSNKIKNLITIQEILNIEKAKSLFLSSYCLDFEFLKKIIPFTKMELPITLSKHWNQKEEKKGREFLKIGICPVCICHPPLLGNYSNMHAKLFMIEFDNFIRIVISSANLTEFDWNYFKQNIWIQDFPKKESNSKSSNFENTLVEFWTKLTDGIPGNFLRKYDYSNAKGVLIPSIPGYHTNEKSKYGQLAIKKSIENFKIKNSKIYFQMSSIGSMNLDWIKELSNSFNLKDFNNFNIVFPSLETVSKSHFGLKCGGMIHLKSKTFETSTFPKQLLTHYLPNQSNHLAHSKIILNLQNLKNGFIFIGSHNLSQPALGKLQKNESQLYISNYELGILFDLNNFRVNQENEDELNEETEINNENLEKYFNLTLPFKIPASRMNLKHDSPFILETVQDLLD